MFDNLKEKYNENKVISITTSITALAGLIYAFQQKKPISSIVGYTLLGAFSGVLISTVINKISNK